MRHHCARIVLVVSAFGLGVDLGFGQSAPKNVDRTIRDKATCVSCAVVVAKDGLVLGDSEHSPGANTSTVFRAKDGRYFVLQFNEPPWVYDSSGQFVRELGMAGEGPGEYRSPSLVATGPGDSLLIMDDGLRRATILSPTLRYARSFSAPTWVSAVAWFPTGQLIFSGVLSLASRAGYALHLLTSVGVPEKSFAESDRGYSAREPQLAQRLIPAIRSDRFLAVTRYQPYAIEDWSLGGDLHTRWQRPNTYFDDNPKRIPGLAPPAYVQSAEVDEARGLLFVLVRVPDKRWKQGLKPAPGPGGEQSYTIISPDLIYDSVFEVIDLVKEELVARTRLDEIYLGLMSSDRLALLKEQADGSYKLTLHRLALRGR